MQAGKTPHQVTIQQDTATALPNGEKAAPTWETFSAGVWVGIRAASAKEMQRGQELGHEITQTVTLRYLPGLSARMRILFGSRVLYIAGLINVDERSIEHRALCYETT